MNGLKTMAGKCILYIIYSVQYHCEQEKTTNVTQEKQNDSSKYRPFGMRLGPPVGRR